MKTEGLDRKTLYRRLGGFLARQGFSPEIVHETLDRHFSTTSAEEL
jgi:hypothetical protein